jgi:hypothetical protein
MIARLTWHAEQRRVEHGYTLEQVELAVCDPQLEYPAPRRWPDRFIRVHSDVKCVVSSTGVVITVMPADQSTGYQPWSHGAGFDEATG